MSEPKVKRTAPEGAILPDRGWPKFLYALNKLFGRPDKVPTISDAQRAELEAAEQERLRKEHHAARLQYRQDLITRQRTLANDGVRAVVCVANVKSGTKSATAIGASTEFAENSRKRTLLFPMTANTATVTAGKMAGIRGNAVTVDQYIDDIKSFRDPWELEGRLPLTPAGLGVIVEGRSTAANDDDHDKVVKFVQAVDVSLGNVSYLWLDLGNDNISKRAVALQAARLAHVLVFPFDYQSPISHHTLRETLDGYRSDREIPQDIWDLLYENFEHKNRTGLNVPTPDKVARSIIVASKTDGEVDFNFHARPAEQNANANDTLEWNGTGITVPHEEAWLRHTSDGDVMPYSREAIQLDTHIAYLEIGVAALELAGYQQGYDIGTPMVANIPELRRSSTEKEGSVSS